ARWTHAMRGGDAGWIGLAAARRAVRAEGALGPSSPFLVVELEPAASIAAGRARHSFGGILQAQAPGTEAVRVSQKVADPARLLAGREGRALVVVVRDAHRYAWERGTATALLDAAGGGTVIELGVPVWRPEPASAFIATYGGGRVNLEAAVERLLRRAASVDVGQRRVD